MDEVGPGGREQSDERDSPDRDDHNAAADLAGQAGVLLLKIRDESGFSDPASLRAHGDRIAHEFLMEGLRERRPDDCVLSEEAVDERRRLEARRVWIIDPLDGTREFAEEGRVDWAVHVALWEEGRLVAGAVALPALDVTLSTAEPVILGPRRPGPPRIVVSRSRPPAVVDALRSALGAELIPMGSAGAKVAAVVRGTADAYVHAGGQYEWDSAAPVAVARAVALHATRLDGSDLRYNLPDPYLPDLVVCRPELAAEILAAIARFAADVAVQPS